MRLPRTGWPACRSQTGAALGPASVIRGPPLVPACEWQLGGPFIPGTTNEFGGNSAAEFGPLLSLAYPAANGAPTFRYNNFRNVLGSNPCPA